MAEEKKTTLEEAAEKYATEWHKNPDGSAWKPYFEESAIKAFKAGAKWQKEQMLKEAVEGFIYQSADYYPKELIARYDGELGMGDKVKILIIPEKEDKEC